MDELAATSQINLYTTFLRNFSNKKRIDDIDTNIKCSREGAWRLFFSYCFHFMEGPARDGADMRILIVFFFFFGCHFHHIMRGGAVLALWPISSRRTTFWV